MAGLPPSNASSAAAAAPAPARQVEGFQEDSSLGSLEPKRSGYGLPCANCKTYYTADLAACPVCKSPQRVSPIGALPRIAPAEQLPDPRQIEEEREHFLRDLNATVITTPLAQESVTPAAHCIRPEKHLNSPAPASICQSCYDELQRRVDVLEATLHMDLREAAQIVYDAVWADTSDSSKTYQNAAQALLIELRRRSAVTQVFGQFQTPTN
jgi:hypothetical protein